MELVAGSYAVYVDCCLRIVHSVVGEPATVILVRELQTAKKHWIIARLSIQDPARKQST